MVSAKDKEKYAKYLATGEEIMAVFKVGSKYFWAKILTDPLHFFKNLRLRHGKAYILTNRRVLVKDGIFSTRLISAPYDKITHMSVKEDFFTKMAYGVGDITIHTAGPTPIEIDLIKICQPVAVKNLIEELMVKEKIM